MGHDVTSKGLVFLVVEHEFGAFPIVVVELFLFWREAHPESHCGFKLRPNALLFLRDGCAALVGRFGHKICACLGFASGAFDGGFCEGFVNDSYAVF